MWCHVREKRAVSGELESDHWPVCFMRLNSASEQSSQVVECPGGAATIRLLGLEREHGPRSQITITEKNTIHFVIILACLCRCMCIAE